MPQYVYILRSSPTGRLYVGITDDVPRRLKEHNTGKSRSTKPWIPWELTYVESHPDEGSARKREWQLKCTPTGGKEKKRLAETPKAADKSGQNNSIK